LGIRPGEYPRLQIQSVAFSGNFSGPEFIWRRFGFLPHLNTRKRQNKQKALSNLRQN